MIPMFVNDKETTEKIECYIGAVEHVKQPNEGCLEKHDNNSVGVVADNLVETHKNICEELNQTYEKKNHDYGNSFGETFNKLGIISAVTRITDKYNRLVSLCTLPDEERQVKDETISDTLLDMANYCIMTEIELRKRKENINN